MRQPTPSTRIAFDLPGDDRLEGLNREVAALIAHDVDVALAALPEHRHAAVVRDLVRRLVLGEAQLLTGAVVEALGRRLRTRAALDGLRSLDALGPAGAGRVPPAGRLHLPRQGPLGGARRPV